MGLRAVARCTNRSARSTCSNPGSSSQANRGPKNRGRSPLFAQGPLLHHKPAGALDALAPSHGGRARAVRAVVANDIGMSRQTVERYMRFRDQVKVAAAGRARLQVVEG